MTMTTQRFYALSAVSILVCAGIIIYDMLAGGRDEGLYLIMLIYSTMALAGVLFYFLRNFAELNKTPRTIFVFALVITVWMSTFANWSDLVPIQKYLSV